MDLQQLQVFEQFADNVDFAFWVCSPDVTEYYYMSPGYEKIWGRTVASLIENPHSFLEAVHPDDVERVTQAAIGKEPWNMDEEYRVIRPDGTIRWVRDRTYPIYDDQGNIYRMAGTAEDITERKQELKDLNQSLEQFKQFVDNADIVFLVWDIEITKFLYISPSYEKIWGRSCDSLYKEPRSFLEALHPEDIPPVIAAMKNNPTSIDGEYRIILPNGTMRWIRERTFPNKDENGRVNGIVGVAEDITHRKQAEEETYKALQREQELSNAKSEFIATISHEIRTPLSVIQSSADILHHNIDKLTNEKKQKHFQKVNSSVQRIASIVEDLLIIAEDEAGSLQFQPTEVDVVQLCQEIINTIVNYNNRRINFKVSGNATSSSMLDAKLIHHILVNLLENALKYSQPDTKIELELSLLSNQIKFRVQDQGIGIPTENLSHIFNSFYRAKNVETKPGTGLGLSIVKRCVDIHHGGIAVNSSVGKGTIFTVTLPREI
ncbi:PAS domain S-box [Rivularia sp. PCC 7116]|uniref:sensor histidine kinase n=1 Tax=Rivularia sp. PCC 7116 TaxID=373994 RepID=UPI00029EFDD7|nr:PAS domain-containing sensor histidine kinase [Rivularia sp. PCC 7116]AFY57090.1 PAS domain S-box [Rivularia sp. PCC 7116]